TLPNVGSVQVIRNTSQNDYPGTFSLYQDSTTVVSTYTGLDPYFYGMNFVAPHTYTIKYVSSRPATTYYFLETRIAPPTPRPVPTRRPPRPRPPTRRLRRTRRRSRRRRRTRPRQPQRPRKLRR